MGARARLFCKRGLSLAVALYFAIAAYGRYHAGA